MASAQQIASSQLYSANGARFPPPDGGQITGRGGDQLRPPFVSLAVSEHKIRSVPPVA